MTFKNPDESSGARVKLFTHLFWQHSSLYWSLAVPLETTATKRKQSGIKTLICSKKISRINTVFKNSLKGFWAQLEKSSGGNWSPFTAVSRASHCSKDLYNRSEWWVATNKQTPSFYCKALLCRKSSCKSKPHWFPLHLYFPTVQESMETFAYSLCWSRGSFIASE